MKLLIVGIIFIFIGRFIFNNIDELRANLFHFNLIYLSISLILTVLYVFIYSLIWHYLTVKSNCSIDFGKTITARVNAEFGKYVPGRALGLAIILYWYNRERQSKKLVSFCLLFEYIATLLGAIIAFLISIYFVDVDAFNKYRLLALFFALCFTITIHPVFLEFILNKILKLVKYEEIRIEITYADMLKIVLFNVMNWLLLGMAMFFLINAVYLLSFNDVLFIIASFSLASFFGLIALITPAGLGVRESILIFVLSILIPKSIAGVISVLSRLWLLLAETILFCLVIVFNKLKKASPELI